ncbi:hypothetical protein [Sinorhizobium medicae]|uniref:hypothetical protein n=1 Tax=Sinorhizobium medicae TaxID=110321 RepID=UPI0013DDE035|nr:hypothetical protein [Sinorhizobium medicae]MBO1960689.1 hypothetical protein [Sinorhizobium medicae]WQO54101.1 hypothetical protein U8C36_24095 [Sinorhizobium medicae]WQO61851.1 hypothetical protein U8C35_22985 [Sinorhizobium medicae]WQP40808.1 hypothetical protein U8C38_22440 [Sinorhizobium medicae]
MSDWEQVSVKHAGGEDHLLENGTGSGSETVFACGKFDSKNRPKKGDKYHITATPKDEIFAMDWTATCTFSGETSEFKVE